MKIFQILLLNVFIVTTPSVSECEFSSESEVEKSPEENFGYVMGRMVGPSILRSSQIDIGLAPVQSDTVAYYRYSDPYSFSPKIADSFCLKLSPRDYRVTSFRAQSGNEITTYKNLNIPFTVKPGRVTNLGTIFIQMGDGFYQKAGWFSPEIRGSSFSFTRVDDSPEAEATLNVFHADLDNHFSSRKIDIAQGSYLSGQSLLDFRAASCQESFGFNHGEVLFSSHLGTLCLQGSYKQLQKDPPRGPGRLFSVGVKEADRGLFVFDTPNVSDIVTIGRQRDEIGYLTKIGAVLYTSNGKFVPLTLLPDFGKIVGLVSVGQGVFLFNQKLDVAHAHSFQGPFTYHAGQVVLKDKNPLHRAYSIVGENALLFHRSDTPNVVVCRLGDLQWFDFKFDGVLKGGLKKIEMYSRGLLITSEWAYNLRFPYYFGVFDTGKLEPIRLPNRNCEINVLNGGESLISYCGSNKYHSEDFGRNWKKLSDANK